MTGEQVQAPSSPREGEDVAITIGRPKVVSGSTFRMSATGLMMNN
jgi:hypothetical protein